MSTNLKRKVVNESYNVLPDSKRITCCKVDINYENRLRDEFFDEKCLVLCKKLLNKYLIRKTVDENNTVRYSVGKIVEVEAYTGGTDRASHTYNNRQTERLKAMYMKAGTAYVYNIYGMYCCLNISSQEPGAGVLIRALEPVHGVELMKSRRNFSGNKANKSKNLSNGPSKLCIAMQINKALFNQQDLSNCETLWLQENMLDFECHSNFKIVAAKRIGINYAGEDAINKLYRFYIKHNWFISVKSKEEINVDL